MSHITKEGVLVSCLRLVGGVYVGGMCIGEVGFRLYLLTPPKLEYCLQNEVTVFTVLAAT